MSALSTAARSVTSDAETARPAAAAQRPATERPAAQRPDWRSPVVVVLGGCLIAMLAFGPRSALGFFLTPLSATHGWGRDIYALAIAMQSLLYGAAQPFAGALADRFGAQRVIVTGALLYALGIFLMAQASTPAMLYLSAGVLVGFGLSGCSFNLVITSIAKVVPESWRSMVFGAGTAAGSFGQFLFSPLGVGLIDAYGWRTALEIFSGLLLLIIPLALLVAKPRSAPSQARAAGALRPKPTGRRWPKPCGIAPMCCWFSASSPAASSSASSPFTCRPI